MRLVSTVARFGKDELDSWVTAWDQVSGLAWVAGCSACTAGLGDDFVSYWPEPERAARPDLAELPAPWALEQLLMPLRDELQCSVQAWFSSLVQSAQACSWPTSFEPAPHQPP